MTRWTCCFLLIAALLFSKSFANSGGPLTAEELISMIDEVKILDFRGEYFRELDGYIPGSIPMKSEFEGSQVKFTLSQSICLKTNIIRVHPGTSSQLELLFDFNNFTTVFLKVV